MALKDVDLESALRRLAERRIEEAMREGKFDNLPGAGQPIELEPLPADENARAMWWALKILRQNDVIPDEVRWRKTIDHLKARLATARDESTVRSLVTQINGLVRQLNTLGTNAINLGVAVVSLDDALAAFHQRQSAVRGGASAGRCTNHLCGTNNLPEARFCRRCGALLTGA
jgi:hypothetical protein